MLFISVAFAYETGDAHSDCIKGVVAPSCKPYYYVTKSYRRYDGLCNNLRFPHVGAGRTPLRRLIWANYVDQRQVDTPRGFPGTKPRVPPANKVSLAVFHAKQNDDGNRWKLSTLFMTMGQFLDHDFALVGHSKCKAQSCNSKDAYKYPCFPIKFTDYGSKCTPFTRSQPICQKAPAGRRTDRQIANLITSFVDLSQVYGASIEHAKKLRKNDGSGEMAMRSGNLLPLSNEPCDTIGGCSMAGDPRADENIALYSMHTVWIREHNRVVKKLRKNHKTWSGEKLYQEARKIVIAEYQHIIFNDWVPRIVDIGPYTGYSSRYDATLINAFSTAAFRFGHSLVPNEWQQCNSNYDKIAKDISLQSSFFNIGSINQRGIEPTVYGLMANQSNQMDTNFAFDLVRRLFVPPGHHEHHDLTALNIQRGRDHGLPTYGAWRKYCRLPPISSYKDLEQYMSIESVKSFQKLYSHPNDIDLFAAGIAEHNVPRFQTGPIFRCLFWHQFKRLREGDRYYYLNPGVFTHAQRRELTKTSMAKILCNNLN
eukprot:TCONS_00019053-protein